MPWCPAREAPRRPLQLAALVVRLAFVAAPNRCDVISRQSGWPNEKHSSSQGKTPHRTQQKPCRAKPQRTPRKGPYSLPFVLVIGERCSSQAKNEAIFQRRKRAASQSTAPLHPSRKKSDQGQFLV